MQSGFRDFYKQYLYKKQQHDFTGTPMPYPLVQQKNDELQQAIQLNRTLLRMSYQTPEHNNILLYVVGGALMVKLLQLTWRVFKNSG